jgi:hypothetical protein
MKLAAMYEVPESPAEHSEWLERMARDKGPLPVEIQDKPFAWGMYYALKDRQQSTT